MRREEKLPGASAAAASPVSATAGPATTGPATTGPATGPAVTGPAATGPVGHMPQAAAEPVPAVAEPAHGVAEPAAGEPQKQGTAPDRIPWLIALAVFAAYLPISVFRYLRLDPTSWDLGIFTEYVKQYAHLHAPIVDVRGAGYNLFGNHFHPIVALIAPFFRVFPTPVTLLVAQALLTAVSVIPVSRAAADLLGTGAGRAIGAAYGFSWGLQQLVNFDFHEIALALPLVLVKEDQGFTVAAIGILMAVVYRERVTGFLLAAWGLAWSLLCIFVI